MMGFGRDHQMMRRPRGLTLRDSSRDTGTYEMDGKEAYDAVKHALEVSNVCPVPRYPFDFHPRYTGRLPSHRKWGCLYPTSTHSKTVGLSGVVLQRTRMWPGDP